MFQSIKSPVSIFSLVWKSCWSRYGPRVSKKMSDSNQSTTNDCGCQSVVIRVTSCETWEHEKKFTVYKVYINGFGNSWHVFRRFQEFHDLYEQLKPEFSTVQLKLPKKTIFRNLNPNFVEQRRAGLDAFAQQIIANYDVLHHPKVQQFFMLGQCKNRRRSSPADSSGSSGASTNGDSTRDRQSSQETEPSRNNELISLGPTERSQMKPADFEFFNVIGKGSFGKVFLARHKSDRAIYAVKVLQKDQIKRRNEVKHIMAERNVLVENVRHPFLVGLHYSFQTKDKLYFVLDYVNGGELYFHLQREKTFNEQRSRFYGAEIASALGYLHSKNIIYRDLKPENLLLDKEGHVVLTDFGLCKEGIRENDTTGTFCGTAEYLAPEVILKQQYDKTVDWWCLGSVLYEMMFGLPPFYNRDHRLMYENILYKPLRMRNTISAPAKDILVGLLQKERAKRLGSLHDFDEIKHHPFFSSMDWAELEARHIKPPFNPGVNSQMDLKNIDKDFLVQSIPNSVTNALSPMSNVPDQDFAGFSYIQSPLSHHHDNIPVGSPAADA